MSSLKEFRQSEDFVPKTIMLVCGIAFFIVNFIRIFDSNFWCDETFSYVMSFYSLPRTIFECAMDMHPPLYYVFLNIWCDVFGHSGPALHASSLVPYVALMYIAYSRIYKKFGLCPALLMITFVSIMPLSVRYNVDVRMYLWVSVFMLLAYLQFYDVLEDFSWRNLKLFMIYSLLGAYTHYYCILGITALCIVMLVLYRKDSERIRLVKRSVKYMLLIYAPWAVFLLRSFIIASSDFWISDIPSIADCYLLLFDGYASIPLFIIMILSVAAIAAIGYRRTKQLDTMGIWLISGFVAITIPILIGIVCSYTIRPMLLLRYLLFTTVIAWIMLSVAVTRMDSIKLKGLATVLVLTIVLMASVPEYVETYNVEYDSWEQTKDTLDLTSGISNKDTILTDVSSVRETKALTYYSCERIVIDWDDTPDLDINHRYWLFLGDSISQQMIDWLASKGFGYELITENGSLGSEDDPIGNYHRLGSAYYHIYRAVPL